MDFKDEKWATIKGYENYQISNYGRLKRLEHYTTDKQGRVRHYKEKMRDKFALCGGRTKKGNKGHYYYTALTDGSGKQGVVGIHRLVATYFCDNPNNYTEIDHINRVKTDNRAENLRWVTRSENNIGVKKGMSYKHTEEFYKNHPNYKK